jgi:8-oxo-dGTP diphosphatase
MRDAFLKLSRDGIAHRESAMRRREELLWGYEHSSVDTNRASNVYPRVGTIRIRCAAVLIRDDEILLVKHRKNGCEYWLLPGGGLEPGETVTQATERELLEECGVTVQCDRLLFMAETLAPDNSRQILHLVFLAQLLGGEPRLCESDSERLVAVAWVHRKTLASVTFYPDFRAELLHHWNMEFLLQSECLGNLWKD